MAAQTMTATRVSDCDVRPQFAPKLFPPRRASDDGCVSEASRGRGARSRENYESREIMLVKHIKYLKW